VLLVKLDFYLREDVSFTSALYSLICSSRAELDLLSFTISTSRSYLFYEFELLRPTLTSVPSILFIGMNSVSSATDSIDNSLVGGKSLIMLPFFVVKRVGLSGSSLSTV
jgi:hypothetical protein